MHHPTPWTVAYQAPPSMGFFQASVLEWVAISILCHPLLLLPSVPPSIRVFSNESTLRMRWPKYWCFSFSIIPSKEIPGLISFRMDWFDLPVVQGTLKSLLQHHSSKTLGALNLGLGVGEQPGLMENLRVASGGSHALVCRTPRPYHQIRPPLSSPWPLTEVSALPRATSAF